MNNKKIIAHDINLNTHEVDVKKLKFRPSVYGILIENNKILLSKQWDGYDFPGGGIEIGETIEEALVREVFEETGLKVKPLKVVHTQTAFFKPTKEKVFWNCVLIYYIVKKIGGDLTIANCDEREKKYISLPEWILLSQIGKIKFYNGVDSPKLIRKLKVSDTGRNN